MNGGNLIQFAGDKTLLFGCIGVTGIMRLPCSADGRIICRILPIHIKYQIGTGNDFVVITDKSTPMFFRAKLVDGVMEVPPIHSAEVVK